MASNTWIYIFFILYLFCGVAFPIIYTFYNKQMLENFFQLAHNNAFVFACYYKYIKLRSFLFYRAIIICVCLILITLCWNKVQIIITILKPILSPVRWTHLVKKSNLYYIVKRLRMFKFEGSAPPASHTHIILANPRTHALFGTLQKSSGQHLEAARVPFNLGNCVATQHITFISCLANDGENDRFVECSSLSTLDGKSMQISSSVPPSLYDVDDGVFMCSWSLISFWCCRDLFAYLI